MLLGNADVLEVIAEYACGTVADACALRGSCKGYRRAVDTTVRRLVYEDQPELRLPRSDGSQPATLHVHLHTEHLDAVRIALTCDAFPRIARVVVVAFALDAAKDEAHEGGACGPRPVTSVDHYVEFFNTCNAASVWSKPLQLRKHNTSRAEAALVRCLTDATTAGNHLTDVLCTAIESASRPWAGVRFLAMPSRTGSFGNGARLLRAIGPQLTHLAVDTCDRTWCAILAACSNLVEVQITVAGSSSPTTAAICDALISSGAKIERVRLHIGDPAEAVRLLEAVPTIVVATVFGLSVLALPRAVAGRLQRFNDTACHERLPCLRYVDQTDQTWMPSQFAATVVGRTSLPVADLATAFPKLRALHIPGIAPGIDPDAIAFPRTLEEVTARPKRRNDAASTAAVVCALARHGPAHLCNLADVSLTLFAHSCRGIAPLGCFASTLRTITLYTGNEGAAWTPDDIASVEATLAQLVSLEQVDITALPTARCFLGGKHTRLRSLSLGGMGVPFGGLVKSCPRLTDIQVETEGTVDAGLNIGGDGWTSARRLSGFQVRRRSMDP